MKINNQFIKSYKNIPRDEKSACAGCADRPFRERVEESFRLFEENSEKLCAYIDGKCHDEMLSLCTRILSPAFDAAFELGFNGTKYELILSPNGSVASVFVLDYYRKHMTDKLKEKWNIIVGRQPNPNIALKMGDVTVNADEFDIWVEKGENSVNLDLYCEKLVPVLKGDESMAYEIMYILLDNTVGELAGMRYIGEAVLLPEKKKEDSIRMSQLPAYISKVFDVPQGGVCSPEIFYDSYSGYRPVTVEDENRFFDRSDVFIGVTCCYPLIYEYLNGETAIDGRLMSNGICAGYFVYSNERFDNEAERGAAMLDFREDLQNRIYERAGEDCVFFTGGATGVFGSYIDFIAWDIGALLEAAADVMKECSLEGAFFHGMRKDSELLKLI